MFRELDIQIFGKEQLEAEMTLSYINGINRNRKSITNILKIGSTFVPDFVHFVHWQACFYKSFKSVVEKFNVFRIIVSLGKWSGESP